MASDVGDAGRAQCSWRRRGLEDAAGARRSGTRRGAASAWHPDKLPLLFELCGYRYPTTRPPTLPPLNHAPVLSPTHLTV